MTNGFAAHQHANQAKCEVCDCAISYLDSLQINELGYPVCRSLACRNVMSQKSAMAPVLFKSHLEFNKKLIHQRRETEAARKKYIDEVTAKEQQVNCEILHSLLEDHPELTNDDVQLLAIPSGYSKLMPVTSARIDKYIEHLKRIVSEASEYSNASEVIYDEHHDAHGKMTLVEDRFGENPELRSISDRLCAMCKGGCCADGKEHAYLSVITIRRYMDTNPDLSAEDILELYLSKTNSESIESSCINHRKTGCALPRHLRSDICNGYYCDSLKSYQKESATRENPGLVLVVQRSCTNWNRFEPDVCHEVVNVVLLENGS